MAKPEGYGPQGQVCLLKKSIYGLKQAGRYWFERLREALMSLALKLSEADLCLPTAGERQNSHFYRLRRRFSDIYRQPETTRGGVFKARKIVSIEIPRPRKDCLGIHITQLPVKKTILLNQKEYIIRMLERFNLTRLPRRWKSV